MARKQADRAKTQTDFVDNDSATNSSQSTNRSRRRQQSIKRRVVRLVLVPGAAALALWIAASGYLVFQGVYNREVAIGVRDVSIPAVPALASIQLERHLGIAYLTQPANNLQELLDQRRQTDEQLAALRRAADARLANAPDSVATQWKTLTDHLDQLPSIRTTVDSRSAREQDAYAFYNELLDAATELFDTQARIVPDAKATQGGIIATEVFRASDMMSRASSTIDAAFGVKALDERSYLDFVSLVGAYRSAMENVAVHLEPGALQRWEAITAGDSWRKLTAAEDALITSGVWRNGAPRALPVNQASWKMITRQVSAELIELTIGQAGEVSTRTLRTGNNQLLTASLGSLVALAIAIAAIIWAVRQSQVLVDQALSRRLAQLGADAATMVDQRLPAVMDRLRRHERVDLAVELPTKDYGTDEIGQVADVINRSLQVAAGAAIDEAKIRTAGVAMLMGVARRPQRPLQHGLKVIENLQSRIGDEELLSELFDINHQLTQTRRFLENLVVLAGGQIGRRFKNPIPVRRVLLAAFAESQHYQRITLRSAADVAVRGHAVAGTIHILAELLDNALVFSPPETTVWVTCNEVRNGVAVEIEDAGVGMRPDALERANMLLTNAPTPDVTALKDGAQVGLHVVAELAKREGVQVSLRTSAYGGLLAIVLLPERVIVAGHTPDSPGTAVPGVTVPGTPVPGAAIFQGSNGSGPHHPPYAAAAPATGRVATVAGGPVWGRQQLDLGEHQRPTGAADPTGPRSNGHPQVVRQPEATTPPPVADAPPRTGAPPARPAGAPGPASHGGTTAGSRPPLPHRQPQQHLVPELREDTLAAPEPSGPPGSARSPEEARNRFARYQQAWTAGRAAGTDDTATKDDQGRKA